MNKDTKIVLENIRFSIEFAPSEEQNALSCDIESISVESLCKYSRKNLIALINSAEGKESRCWLLFMLTLGQSYKTLISEVRSYPCEYQEIISSFLSQHEHWEQLKMERYQQKRCEYFMGYLRRKRLESND